MTTPAWFARLLCRLGFHSWGRANWGSMTLPVGLKFYENYRCQCCHAWWHVRAYGADFTPPEERDRLLRAAREKSQWQRTEGPSARGGGW